MMEPLFPTESENPVAAEGAIPRFPTASEIVKIIDLLDLPIVADYRKLEGKDRHKYRTIYQMLRAWGITPGHTCRECKHLVVKTGDFAGHFLKCETYEDSRGIKGHPWRFGSSTTDWRARWPSCGRFEEKDATA